MKRLRASLFSYVEMLGLPQDQSQAFKTTVRAASTQFWTDHEVAMYAKIESCAASLMLINPPAEKTP